MNLTRKDLIGEAIIKSTGKQAGSNWQSLKLFKMSVLQISMYRRFGDLQRNLSVYSCDLCDQIFTGDYELQVFVYI